MTHDYVADAFRRWGYLQADLDLFGRIAPFAHEELDQAPPAEAQKWRSIYCAKIGVEFMHMPYPARCRWVAQRLEGDKPQPDRRQILKRILSAETFERYLHTRYVGNKRFSLEGTAALIPLLDTIINRAAEQGFEVVMIGMTHRGRLNVMVHIANTPPSNIFAGFEDVDPKSVLGSGDVKYHKGATGIYEAANGKKMDIHLSSNPSHLEAINPVLTGRVRARQERLGDSAGKKVLAIVLHGDAAFAGQGIAAETLNFAALRGFSVGGTVHIIVNNLIGFTAQPKALHSSRFSSDIIKRLPVPIFHVNGESPDDVFQVGQIAMDYRNEFAGDVLIDLIGYRRYGHSEIDDPTITAPVLYSRIQQTPPLYQNYAKQIGASDAELRTLETETEQALKAAQEAGRQISKQPSFFKLPDYWGPFTGGYYRPEFEVDTSVPRELLLDIAAKITTVPKDFSLSAKLVKGLEQRMEMARGERLVDWGMAEALAFGSLLWGGVPVRITGQDSGRGTFNHRHAVWYDTKTGIDYIPLRHLHDRQARFDVYDSMLSEAAALGFEAGFARDYPEALVCWEAQFGDFANGAQIIFDQFLAASEDKWHLLCGVTALLPHGYEGQGPEHSSARIERYLQLAAEDNIQVCYPSTAGQFFHLLRRQVLRKWRKPLIVFTPKSMLRAQAASSPVSLLSEGAFENVLDQDNAPDASRVLVCSGKIAHELRAERQRRGDLSTAILTVEQLYPLPEAQLQETLHRYADAKNIVWVQEEPANMGALVYIRPHLDRLSGGRTVTTIRRSESASPATGSPKAHAMEQEALIKLAFANYT